MDNRKLYINNNNVSQHGGAIYNLGANNTFNIKYSSFTSNRAGNYGGAILSDGLNSKTIITSCNFLNNVAGQLGGAIYNQKDSRITGRENFYKNNSVLLESGSGGAICNKGINSILDLFKEEYRSNVAITGSAICNYAINSKINSSIFGQNQKIYSNKTMDARFNWWGLNNGNNSNNYHVNAQCPIIFLMSARKVGQNSNGSINIHITMSVNQYNCSGNIISQNAHLRPVTVSLNHNLNSIITNGNTTVFRIVPASVTSITATLDSQPLTAPISNLLTYGTSNEIENYDKEINISSFEVKKDNEHIILNIDNCKCELNDLLVKKYSQIAFEDTIIVIENGILRVISISLKTFILSYFIIYSSFCSYFLVFHF